MRKAVMLSLQVHSVLGSQCHHSCYNCSCSLHHAIPSLVTPKDRCSDLPWGSSVGKKLSPILAAGSQSGCSVIKRQRTCLFPAAQTLLLVHLCTAGPSCLLGHSRLRWGGISTVARVQGLAWAGLEERQRESTLFPRTMNLEMFSREEGAWG